jgi:hypothetical protein
MDRKTSYKSSVIYRNVQTFFETKRKLEITLVKHVLAESIEIIAYDPLLNIEAERIYVNDFCLGSKLSPKSVKDTFTIRSTSMCRTSGGTPPDRTSLMKDITTSMSISLILARIKIPEHLSPMECAIYLQPFASDDVILSPPESGKTDGSSQSSVPKLDFEFPCRPDEVIPHHIERPRLSIR